MIIDLTGKVVVVTGSSNGLGRKLAYEFAKEGAFVVINYCLHKTEAEGLLSDISSFNPNCSIYKADVTKEEEVKNLASSVIEKYGKIDILINNAGKCKDSLFPIMSLDTWREVVSTNLEGVFIVSKYFSKYMIKQKFGKIFNISSYKGQVGWEGQANYSSSKAGVISLTQTMAKELGQFGISVNAICPGYIETNLNFGQIVKTNKAKEKSALSIEHGLEDYINFLKLMSSDAIKGVSGRVFNIDSRIK